MRTNLKTPFYEFLESKKWVAYVLLGSPLFLFIAYFGLIEVIGSDQAPLKLIFGALFLGSFHIILSPLFYDGTLGADRKKIILSSILVFFIGAFLQAFSMMSLANFSSLDSKFFLVILVGFVAYHSIQQQLGLVLYLEQGLPKGKLKFCFNTLFAVVLVDWVFFLYNIFPNLRVLVFFPVALVVFFEILHLSYKKVPMNSFYWPFVLRLITWPLSIYFKEMRVVVFAIHGIEYLCFYIFYKNLNSRVRGGNSWAIGEVIVLLVLTMGSYTYSLLLNPSKWENMIVFLTSFHFGLQFRHYWLDRKMFRGSALLNSIGKNTEN